ncbi:MAG: bifunctional diguanylate cyclase/phosphodiesterase, partial [Pseudomonadota bacterium]|nr:bifunctional diguanylate cyclase/phosphodiesterase [Pseudomonadota bacterium]
VGHLAAAGLLAVAIAGLLSSRLRPARPPAYAPSDRDDLTGLCNRACFQAELDRRLLSHSGEAAALLFADLDGFKEVNDSLGHDVGDQLLNKVAERFALAAPPGVLLARLGGDEFGAAAFGPGAEARIRDFAEAMVDALADPIATDEDHLTVGVSIGLAHGTAGSITSKELLRRSDVAMYRAKHDNRLQIQPFELQMDEALNFRRTMRQDLALALSGDQLDLHLQPVVNARTGELTSAEALLRWIHPVLGAVSPAKLIALAEESGQIISIDDWVLERALNYATQLRTIPIAVNISPVQFRHPGFARKIVDRLEAHSVPADMLRLEITEGVLVTHTRAAARAIGELREAGIKIALDDFGTGFSSLSYLKDFNFDLLKVDRSFVLELDKGRQGAELLRAIVDLGHSLGMSVIAEGVETANQAGLVQLLGCDYIQGYFTGRPMGIEAFEARRSEPHAEFQVPRPLPLRARQR